MNEETIRAILVINLGGIGDILLSTPALKALRQRYPCADITLLTTPGPAEALKSAGYLTSIRVFDTHPGGSGGFTHFTKNLKTLFELRGKGFDLAINMRTLYSVIGALKIRVLLGIVGAKATAGRDTEGRGAFFDIKIPETNAAEKYERDYDIEMAEALGAKVGDMKIDFTVSSDDRIAARRILEGAQVSRSDILVGIHPGGKPSRRLPSECFAKIATILHRKSGCRFVLTGDANERALAEQIIRMSGIDMVNAAGRLSIGAAGAIIERCNAYISNDTANMHLAAILKTPLVAVFGPGNLTRFDPRRISDKAAVIYHRAVCAPCERMVCGKAECLKAVSAQEVADVALKLLSEGRAA